MEQFQKTASNTDTGPIKEDLEKLNINDSSQEQSEKQPDLENESEDPPFYDCLSEEELEAKKEEAVKLKDQGNELYKSGEYQKACDLYTQALDSCPEILKDVRSVIYSNRAAAQSCLINPDIETATRDSLREAIIADCSEAIKCDPNYLKPLLRRAKLYEEMGDDKLDECHQDYKKILELDPGNAQARQACIRLPPLIEQRNERLKNEMLDKLKQLGNTVLRPFGLSTENFALQQNPETGGYSIQFNNARK